MGWENALSGLSRGKQFRLHRRMVQQTLRQKESLEYYSVQKSQANILAQSILSDPGNHEKHLARFVFLVYG